MSAKKKTAKKAAKRATAKKSGKATRAAAKAKPARRAIAKPAATKKKGSGKATRAAAKPKRGAAAKPKAKAAKSKAAPARSKAAAKPAKKAAAAPIKRRDGAGHLDPTYAAKLRADMHTEPKDDDRAFAKDALSEELGEEFVETITSGEDEGNEVRDERVTEELGGPFTVSTGGAEFAEGTDASNPQSATREPFPRT
jgi:hypothetical protein